MEKQEFGYCLRCNCLSLTEEGNCIGLCLDWWETGATPGVCHECGGPVPKERICLGSCESCEEERKR